MPTHDELIAMVKECCPLRAPEREERHLMQMENGRKLVFAPNRAMRTISKRWKQKGASSTGGKRILLGLPWAEAWIRKNAELYALAKPGSGRLVSKDAKIKMMAAMYPATVGPHWKDVEGVEMADGVWPFKPVQWLDDVANNWLGGRCAVSLNEEQKRSLDKLPWFRQWLQSLKEKRERKRARGPSRCPESATKCV